MHHPCIIEAQEHEKDIHSNIKKGLEREIEKAHTHENIHDNKKEKIPDSHIIVEKIKENVRAARSSASSNNSDTEDNNESETKEHHTGPQRVAYLGLNTQLTLGYYVGLTWLLLPSEVDELPQGMALLVTPKIANVDWLKMFTDCLNNPISAKYISKCYAIDLDQIPIDLDKSNPMDITPLLLLHYLTLVARIATQGLKRDYLIREENLTSKIKGKLLLGSTIVHNRCQGRQERNWCRYQDYSIDCYENQILKAALRFTRSWWRHHRTAMNVNIDTTLSFCAAAFTEVSELPNINALRRYRINPLYRDYATALRLATMILRRFDYSIQNANNDSGHRVPPFRIDMPKLFELYAYTVLCNKFKFRNIKYQPHGKHGYVDFLKTDEKLIIDTKYKPVYQSEENKSKYDIKDIRQLAGYARDVDVLKELGYNNIDDHHSDDFRLTPDCLILYPNKDSDNFNDCDHTILEKIRDKEKYQIEQFTRFFKYPVKLPVIEKDNQTKPSPDH